MKVALSDTINVPGSDIQHFTIFTTFKGLEHPGGAGEASSGFYAS
jgi:hypothetical protein